MNRFPKFKRLNGPKYQGQRFDVVLTNRSRTNFLRKGLIKFIQEVTLSYVGQAADVMPLLAESGLNAAMKKLHTKAD